MPLRIAFCLGLGLLVPATVAQLKPGPPSSVGISAARLAVAASLLESEVKHRGLGAASILVARRGTVVLHKGFGTAEPDSIYLVASITKPVTASALMLLVEQGRVGLEEFVTRYLPEFTGGDRPKVRVRDLLTHTSGLPDMLPENVELRRSNAPLSEYVKRTYSTPLLYKPGTEYRYQSMGILLAAEIVEKLTGTPLREFEKKNIFGPLRMRHTFLGLGPLKIQDTIPAWISPTAGNDEIEKWGHNSPYWRNIGVPWGGMHTTTTDLAILLQTFLNGGNYTGTRVFSPATVRAMTTNQNAGLKTPRGLGWALSGFGDLLSPRTFGHGGATGTIAWADPETQLLCVILTNRELTVDGGHLLTMVSNAVASSVETQ
ncbi:MAG: beta-lactamase family protein [Acidobacteriota bacterium]|nr:beta-lactamase family protein [Acidobacteriota bacterium]